MDLRARVRQIVGDLRVAVGLDRLPSYSQSRADLGGVPWRTLERTDRWFLESAESLNAISDTAVAEPAALLPVLPGMVLTKKKVTTGKVALPVATSEISGVVDLRKQSLPLWVWGAAASVIATIVVLFVVSNPTVAPAPVAPVAVAPVAVAPAPVAKAVAAAPASFVALPRALAPVIPTAKPAARRRTKR